MGQKCFSLPSPVCVITRLTRYSQKSIRLYWNRQTIVFRQQSNMELTVNDAVVDAVNGVRNTVEQELAGKSLLAEYITAVGRH